MYAVLSALEAESECIIEKLKNKTIENWNGYSFVIGSFSGQECIIGHTGVGKVNSAVVVSHIIEKYNPSIVFYTGIAGALRNDLNIGDVVIAVDSIQWDIDITAFGFKTGELPSAATSLAKNKNTANVRFYKTNPELLQKALKWNPGGFKIRQGRIITGDSLFTTSMQKAKSDLIKELDGYAVDMEGASVGAACRLYNVSCFLARVISDTVKGNKPKRFKQFMKKSSCKMANLIDFIISNFS